MGGKAKMHKKIFLVIFLGVFCLSLKSAYAGKVELSTYYPAPVGEYKNLNTTENTNLATKTGSVTVGTVTDPLPDPVHDNTMIFRPVTGDAAAQDDNQIEGSLRYSKDAGGPHVGGFLYRNSDGWVSLAGGGG